MSTRQRSTKGLLALAGALLVVGICFLRESERRRSRPATSDADHEASEPPAGEDLMAPAEVASPSDALLVAPADAQTGTRQAAAESTLAELHGKFVLEDGHPARGVSLRLQGWEGNQERVLEHGLPESWSDLQGVSGPDGGFSLRFDPPRAFQFTLEAELEGFAAASWRWGEILPAERKDLGTTTLLRGGEIFGRVVNEGREPAGGDWHVYANALPPPGATGRDNTQEITHADPDTGAFGIRDMPPGPVKLTAHSELANWIEGPVVEVRAGERVEADIVYTGPDTSKRITVVPFSRPFYVVRPESSAIRLHGLPGGPVQATKIPGSSQSHNFDDLPAGLYSVSIEDPRFLPWSKEGIAPGSEVEAHLKGNAALRLEVLDAATGNPVEPYSAILRFENVNFGPREFALRERGSDPPPEGTFDGLIPADYTVILEAPLYAPAEVRLDGLAPYETRSLRAILGRGGAIAGTVLGTDGKAAGAGIRIGLVPDLEELATPLDPRRDLHRWVEQQQLVAKLERVSESDKEGRFHFDGIPVGVYRAKAAAPSDLLEAEIGGIPVTEGGETEARIALPAFGSLAGRVLAPAEASLDGMSIQVKVPGKEDVPRLQWTPRTPSSFALAADGSFHAHYLPAGEVTLLLSLPRQTVHADFQSSVHTEGALVEIGRATIVAGEEARVELDARGLFPGQLDLEVLFEGRPAVGRSVTAHGVDDRLGDQGFGNVDQEGHVKIGPLLPGKWILVVQEAEREWKYVLPELLDVAPGATLQRKISFGLHEAQVRLLDSAGIPLADRAVRVLPVTSLPEFVSFHLLAIESGASDTDGLLTLDLPPGEYLVFRASARPAGDVPPPGGTPLSWPPAGPAPFAVTLR